MAAGLLKDSTAHGCARGSRLSLICGFDAMLSWHLDYDRSERPAAKYHVKQCESGGTLSKQMQSNHDKELPQETCSSPHDSESFCAQDARQHGSVSDNLSHTSAAPKTAK